VYGTRGITSQAPYQPLAFNFFHPSQTGITTLFVICHTWQDSIIAAFIASDNLGDGMNTGVEKF